MKDQLTLMVQDIIRQMGAPSEITPVFSRPEASSHGDYSTNVALVLAKTLHQKPIDISNKIKDAMGVRLDGARHHGSDLNTHKKNQNVSGKPAVNETLRGIAKIEVVSPGFVNVFMSEAGLITRMSELLKMDRPDRITHSLVSAPERIVIEFTDPNPFKEFHIGHLYSNAVGESLARLLSSVGHTVRRVNYQGDVGMHVAKAVWGMLEQMRAAGQTPDQFLAEVEQNSLSERVKLLGAAYAAGASAYEENEKAKADMQSINYFVFLAAQETLAAQGNWKPIVDYRRHVAPNAELEKEVSRLYEKGRAWSLEYFESIYRRLGTKFDGYYFESKVGEYGVRTVRDNLRAGIFEESEGAIIFRGEPYGLHTRVFINKLGLPTYEAKELGLAPTKWSDWQYDRSLIVTGKEIVEYFKVLLKALSLINQHLSVRTRHIGHGMVRLPEGKMSSRTGNVRTGDWLMQIVKDRLSDFLIKSNQKYSKDLREDIAEKATIAAVKYSLLRVSLPQDISFDIEKSVSFEGDSGPYLQYTYARCRSVLRKKEAGIQKPEASSISQLPTSNFNQEELAVLRILYIFPEIVGEAAEALAPSGLCTYLFHVAQAYNLFYSKHSILGSATPQNFRIRLTEATANVLRAGLWLLGIESPEQM